MLKPWGAAWPGRRAVRQRSLHDDVHDSAAQAGLTLTPTQEEALALLDGGDNLYVFGPPGRGKTWLIDAYVESSLDRVSGVRRWHLAEFFRDLHVEIGQAGGLSGALAELLCGVDVVCLDEFVVHDPADGVFLDRVVRDIAARRIRLIVTSNARPSELMPNPLFHAAFEPTIALLEEVFTVVDLDDGHDFRRDRQGPQVLHGFRAGRWIIERPVADRPAGEQAETGGVVVQPGSQPLRLLCVEGAHASFGFDEVCGVPANASDYLWLAQRFTCWHVTMPGRHLVTADQASRWATLLDVAHDREIEMIVSAPYGREDLAEQLQRHLPDAARTISRMSSWAG